MTLFTKKEKKNPPLVFPATSSKGVSALHIGFPSWAHKGRTPCPHLFESMAPPLTCCPQMYLCGQSVRPCVNCVKY